MVAARALPVAGDGVARLRPQKQPVYAFNPDKGADLIWKSEGQISNNKDILTSDVATPLYYEGKFFVVYGEDAKTIASNPKPQDLGQPIWTAANSSAARPPRPTAKSICKTTVAKCTCSNQERQDSAPHRDGRIARRPNPVQHRHRR